MYSIIFIKIQKKISNDVFFASDVRSRDSKFRKILDDHSTQIILSLADNAFGIKTVLL